MTPEPESRKSEVALQIVSIAEELGLDPPKVGYMRFQDERVPKLWREESGAIGFNEAFSNCSDAEIRFAAIYLFNPVPEASIPKWIALTVIGAVLMPFISIFVFDFKSSAITFGPNALIFALVFWFAPRDGHARAAHLESTINLAGDPIAARTFLERIYGRVIPLGFFDLSRRDKSGNPIFMYLKYGNDERLKAILRSDLVHPIQGRSES